jgi:hypothetical protein
VEVQGTDRVAAGEGEGSRQDSTDGGSVDQMPEVGPAAVGGDVTGGNRELAGEGVEGRAGVEVLLRGGQPQARLITRGSAAEGLVLVGQQDTGALSSQDRGGRLGDPLQGGSEPLAGQAVPTLEKEPQLPRDGLAVDRHRQRRLARPRQGTRCRLRLWRPEYLPGRLSNRLP